MRNTSTTNKAQRDYMTAKALLQTLEEREAEIEKAYIVANGIQNADGTIPERIYCIEDMETFDKANAETAAEVEGCGLWAEILAARDALTAAEDAMIAYGISLAPAALRATLERGVRESFKTRQKMIDMVFRLDVSTVPREGART